MGGGVKSISSIRGVTAAGVASAGMAEGASNWSTWPGETTGTGVGDGWEMGAAGGEGSATGMG